ncbi:MAG: hypothetical protein KDA60_05330 [Planctomycetales bacterium]|nr:hypothetical protein [Planctomycetales bacterium]
MKRPDTPIDMFLIALARLEEVLETPIVPGELVDWLHEVTSCWELVETHYLAGFRDRHRQMLREIVKQDLGLLVRVEHLRGNAQRIEHGRDTFTRLLGALAVHADETLENQPEIDRRIKRLIDRGLGFVIEARKQEKAVLTWHLEAFQRDRGIAD